MIYVVKCSEQFNQIEENVLSRKKRYLIFPRGASVQMGILLLKKKSITYK